MEAKGRKSRPPASVLIDETLKVSHKEAAAVVAAARKVLFEKLPKAIHVREA